MRHQGAVALALLLPALAAAPALGAPPAPERDEIVDARRRLGETQDLLDRVGNGVRQAEAAEGAVHQVADGNDAARRQLQLAQIGDGGEWLNSTNSTNTTLSNLPKDIIFVLDDSGSMYTQERAPPYLSRLEVCKRALVDDILATKLHEQDRVGLITLNDDTVALDRVGAMHNVCPNLGAVNPTLAAVDRTLSGTCSVSHRQRLQDKARGLYAWGGTPLWTRMGEAVSMMPSGDNAHPNRWIVALTDGAAGDPWAAAGVASQLRTQDGRGIHVLFITVDLWQQDRVLIHDTVERSVNDLILHADHQTPAQLSTTLRLAWEIVGDEIHSGGPSQRRSSWRQFTGNFSVADFVSNDRTCATHADCDIGWYLYPHLGAQISLLIPPPCRPRDACPQVLRQRPRSTAPWR